MPAAIRPLTAARLTPVGRGAVATIRVTKSPCSFEALNSLFHAANQIPLSQQPLQKIAFGHWGQSDPEELVICRVAEDVVEIHCHGGEAAVQRILKDLSQAGCAIVDWRELVASTSDVLESECLDVLSRTTTWRTTRIALEQSSGLLRAAYSQLATVESEQVFLDRIDSLLRWANFGLHLTTPWDVVLTGPPNVGKSSLINALLGYQRAIVFDEPGTTRDIVTGETAFEGWPVMLADTAGIRANVEGLEAAGIALAQDRLLTADLRVVLVDLSQPASQIDQKLLQESEDSILVAHKSDLADRWGDHLPSHAIRVSSVTGEGLKDLQQRLIEHLVPAAPGSGTAVPITQRQVDLLQRLRSSTTADDRRKLLNLLVGNV